MKQGDTVTFDFPDGCKLVLSSVGTPAPAASPAPQFNLEYIGANAQCPHGKAMGKTEMK